jgi:hypothetical protein
VICVSARRFIRYAGEKCSEPVAAPTGFPAAAWFKASIK